jgi:hypothetical protein
VVDEFGTRRMLESQFESVGLKLSEDDVETVAQLHQSFAGQRARLAGAARPETEPMTIPAFDRARHEREATDERTG